MTSSFNIKNLLLLGCLCLLTGCLSFEIKLKPSNQEKVIKSLGTNLVFTCEVVGSVDGNLRIQWIDQNKREVFENTGTTGSVRVYIEKDGPRVRKLYVTKIETKDAGKYSCMAQVDNQHKERSFDLVLYKDITFDETPLSQHPPVFKDSIIKCSVSGEPTPVVSWKFNDTVAIGNEGKGRFFPDKRGLLVKNITQADNGFYTCRAEVETDGRYDERRILVIVHVPPKVIKSIGQVNGTEGDATIISCNATGFPQPVFTFYKDDKILEDAPERLKIESETGIVTINNLLKIDEGQYSCKALNDVGESVGRGSLKVFVTPKIYEYKNITKNEQDVGVLTCKSQGDPYPAMSFRKEGMREDFKMGSNDGGRISVTQKSQGHLELVIRKLIHSDRAVYYCLSKNNVGSDEANGFLDVQYKPRFAWDQINESHSWLGRVHNITCSVKANPSAIIQWVRYDRILENNDTYRIFNVADNSSLQIRVKDGDKNWIYGEYHCLAKNAKGENKQTINLLKADVPEKPKVSVVESTANTLTLRLSPPIDNGGMEIIGYRVEHDNIAYDYSTVDHHKKNHSHLNHDNAWNKQHTNRSVADVKIENLKPKTKYRFRIMAKNEVGVGPSIEFNATTTDKSKPFPIHINSPELGSNSYQYKLTWEKPKTGGYPIKEYEIKFRKATVQTNPGIVSMPEDEDEPGSWMILTHADDPQEPTLSHVITGLDPLTAYEVVIHAHNQLGRSDAEPTFKFSTNEVTEVDLILASRNSVGIGLVLLTTISIFLLILIVVDISCYFLNGCGMTMFVCVRFCDRANPNSKKRHQQLQTTVESTHCNVQTSPSFIEENCEMTTRSNIPGAPEFNPRELSNSMPLGPKPDRRSVLSQGDERWKDVVEELEKELKNKLFERKQTEPSRSKELVKRLSVLEKQSNHGTNESGFVSEKATPEGMLTIDTSSLIGTIMKSETEDEDSKGIENLISIKDDDDKSVEIKLVDLSDDDDGIKDDNSVLAELEPYKDLNNPCEKSLIDVDNSKFQTPNTTTAPKQEMFSKKVSFDDAKIIIVGKME